MNKKIKKLSENLIRKIAAGQVVERPSSVVKELIENSLDAQASFIKIEIEDGGLKMIRVVDNGLGMGKEDLLESFKPHTTSKISEEEDLFSINSLGFRGEALASISAISRVLIKSRSSDKVAGNFVEIENSSLIDKGTVGMPIGTVVEVRNLFGNVPARKKFVKSLKTESRKITEIVSVFALANPKVGFFLSHNKRVVIDLPSEQTLAMRVEDLLGEKFSNNILPISYEDAHFSISGFVFKPQIAKSTKQNQFLFINGRPVSDQLISDAVKDAYGTLLQPKNFPPFVLFFNLPVSLVDVNVHPRKENIEFSDATFVYALFEKAIGEAVGREDSSYEVGEISGLARLLRDSTEVTIDYLPEDGLLPILQVHNLYLVKQTKDGLLLIDQHAAHERILYEDFLEKFNDNVLSEAIELSKPFTFELSVSDSEALQANLKNFEKLGFEISEFGERSFKVTSLPRFLDENNAEQVILEILEDLKVGKGLKSLNSQAKKVLSTLACKSAIKSGDFLNPEERKTLLENLARTKTKYTCPHGRPVELHISLNELARLFRRK